MFGTQFCVDLLNQLGCCPAYEESRLAVVESRAVDYAVSSTGGRQLHLVGDEVESDGFVWPYEVLRIDKLHRWATKGLRVVAEDSSCICKQDEKLACGR